MPRRVWGSFRRPFRAVPVRVAGRRCRRTAFRTAYRQFRGTNRRGAQPAPGMSVVPGRWGCLFRPLRPDGARQADPRPADANPHSRAGLPRATPGPPHGPHATWHAINAACNKTELIRLLAYYKQIYHAVNSIIQSACTCSMHARACAACACM